VLGQTANPQIVGSNALTANPKSGQGEGIIEGIWTDYLIGDNDLFGTSFTFNLFDDSVETEVDGLAETGEEPSDTLIAASF